METHSKAFGFNHTLSIQVITYKYHNKYHNDERNMRKVKMGFHSHFSDASPHNEATTFDHMKKLIHWMYDNTLFKKDGIIYDTTD